MPDLQDYRFAAVDVETTGLSPRHHHRVVEIGIVLFGLDGTVDLEYESLVNPRRDLGGTESIHGLTMTELGQAPTFEEIVEDVGWLLRDRVLVAHNAPFDVRFIEAEFGRAGIAIPPISHLCTMRLAGSQGFGRRLGDVCERLAVLHGQAHTAIGDARAVAGVLSRWHEEHPSRPRISLAECGSLVEPDPDAWPSLSPRGIALVRGEASRRAAAERGYLGRLIDRLPAQSTADSGDEGAYLDVLERALEDRHLSPEEALELAWIAGAEGLSASDIRRLHEAFFQAITAAAWHDGVVTEFEASDLRLVGEFLAIDAVTVDAAIGTRPVAPAPAISGIGIPVGATICFTGALRATIDGIPISRDAAHRLCLTRGYDVRDSVTKALDILIVADPQSLSGKARKAREYGTRIVAESAFWQLIGVQTD